MSEQVNGVRTSYGTRTVETKAPAQHPAMGLVKEFTIEVNGDDLPVWSFNDSTMQAVPAGSFIIELIGYAPTVTTAAVQIDLKNNATGVTLGLTEPALTLNATTWDKQSTELICPVDTMVTATGPAAGEVAYVTVRYIQPFVV